LTLAAAPRLRYAGFTPLQAAVGVVQKGLRPTIPEGVHPTLARLMTLCWEAQPDARPDFHTLVGALAALASECQANGDAGDVAEGKTPTAAAAGQQAGGLRTLFRRNNQ